MRHIEAISSSDLWGWALLALWILLSPLVSMASSFIRFRDVGPPRVAPDVQLFLIFALALAFEYHWIAGLLALAVVSIYCG